jgi:hypothetical protein
MDTTSRITQSCSCCDSHISVGDRITTVQTLNLVDMVTESKLPEVLVELIATVCNQQAKIYHAECAGMNETKTKSGRISKKPVRLGDEKFISGSGFAGCDHYDWEFNGHLPYFEFGPDRKYGQDLKDFVVEDKKPVSPIELPSEDELEEEWESGDETEEDEELEEWD